VEAFRIVEQNFFRAGTGWFQEYNRVPMRWLLPLLSFMFLTNNAICAANPAPSDRASLKGSDWFPYVLSKIAPLESWTFEASSADIKRENYSSDTSYQMSLKNTWDFPRFCFDLFRPKPEAFVTLVNAARAYQGGVIWELHDNCISAFASQPGYVGFTRSGKNDDSVDMDDLLKKFEEIAKNPPKADPEFVKKALADIPQFCRFLDEKLGLKDKEPQQFNSQWLTKAGLRKYPTGNEDFMEGGSWSVALSREPEKLGDDRTATAATAQYLNFGVGDTEMTSILEELGVNWDEYQNANDMGVVASNYRQLAKLVDETADIYYAPEEADALLNDCLRAQEVVSRPESIRGLDKLIRIARWAKQSGLGIYFGGQ
jgi:hypothetical protein